LVFLHLKSDDSPQSPTPTKAKQSSTRSARKGQRERSIVQLVKRDPDIKQEPGNRRLELDIPTLLRIEEVSDDQLEGLSDDLPEDIADDLTDAPLDELPDDMPDDIADDLLDRDRFETLPIRSVTPESRKRALSTTSTTTPEHERITMRVPIGRKHREEAAAIATANADATANARRTARAIATANAITNEEEARRTTQHRGRGTRGRNGGRKGAYGGFRINTRSTKRGKQEEEEEGSNAADY
jgi:hypothetical protein